MPSELKLIQTNTFTGGMSSDIAEEHIPADMYRYMLNCEVLSSDEGSMGVVKNPKGNVIVSVNLPAGSNKTIGAVNDEESNSFYYAVWNSDGYHTWFRFNSVDRTIIKIIQCRTDTGDIDIFNWDEKELILHANVVKNNLLYWSYKGHPPRKINIAKALDKSEEGYGLVIQEEYTRAYKRTAIFAPNPEYITDETKKFNRLYGFQFKFATRFIYDDGEKSNWSDWSVVPLPDEEYFTGTKGVPLKNNGIAIILELGSYIVDKVELAMLTTNKEGGTLNWSSVVVLDKRHLGIRNDSYYEYRFFNEGSYSSVDEEKMIRHYSYLPKDPLCQEFVQNSLVYSNFTEGFPIVDIDASISVRYDDIFIDSGTADKLNEPSFIYTEDDFSMHPVWGRYYDGHFIVGPDVKAGNVFKMTLTSPDRVQSLSTKANLSDTSVTIANKISALLKPLFINNPYNYVEETNLLPGGYARVDFRFTIANNKARVAITTSVNPVNYSTLKDTGQSVLNIKNGSSIKYGFVYEDEDGRQSLSYTSESMIAAIESVNELGELRKPVPSLIGAHKPPVWAKYFHVVRTRDLVYSNFIQVVVQKTIQIETSSGDIYTDLVVGSLFTYQKLHPNTTLRYEFKKGDRVRLISNYSSGAWTTATQAKDFEIIDYKEISVQQKHEDVVVNGSNTVTVTSGSEDNIGSYILIDGSERLIIAATIDTYTLDSNLSTGSYASPHTYPFYEIVNRRGVLRIKFDPSFPITANPTSNMFPLVEIYTPSVGQGSVSENQFFYFGQKFIINNWGTESRAHSGNVQDQTDSQPFIIDVPQGTSYVRNREMPITNEDSNPQVVIAVVEDPSYSDFYVSDMYDNGRVSALDTGDGEVHFGSRVRWSNNYIEDTRINGLNDFDNLDRRDYNDKYGDIVRILFDEGKLYIFKYLKDCWVPVYGNIITDDSGTNILSKSSNILPKSLIYFLWDGGVGNNPESIYRDGNNVFHLSPTSGILARIGGNGVEPISITYGLDKSMREYIKSATDAGANVVGGFNRKKGKYLLSIESHDKVIYNSEFSESGWDIEAEPIVTVGPVVDAGDDKDIVGTTANLSGTATPGSEPIVSVFWTQVSGPNTATIVSPSQLNTQVTGMVEGSYVFRLTAIDAGALSNSDDTTINAEMTGIKVYYGNSGSPAIPSLSEIEASLSVTIPTGSDIEIPFNTEGSPMYSWVAYPSSETIKTKWQDKGIAINNGSIGELSDTFGPYVTIGSYRLTITQYATEFENPIIFKT